MLLLNMVTTSLKELVSAVSKVGASSFISPLACTVMPTLRRAFISPDAPAVLAFSVNMLRTWVLMVSTIESPTKVAPYMSTFDLGSVASFMMEAKSL